MFGINQLGVNIVGIHKRKTQDGASWVWDEENRGLNCYLSNPFSETVSARGRILISKKGVHEHPY